jgi:putative FmdB family regulatory protein
VPVYEFDCKDCGARFEAMAPAGGTPACPACGGERVARRWSQIAPPRIPVGLTGKAAEESNARRKEREARRQEKFKQDRKSRG